jgi:hypothetical protein
VNINDRPNAAKLRNSDHPTYLGSDHAERSITTLPRLGPTTVSVACTIRKTSDANASKTRISNQIGRRTAETRGLDGLWLIGSDTGAITVARSSMDIGIL